MSNTKKIFKTDNYVYDVSLDGTVVNALGFNVMSNTDGFNFQMPSDEELSERHYIGKGLNRNTVEGKEYHGVEADVAEFNDLFMRVKMGLGIDEYAQATINFSRKNYADYLENGKTKLVGNTIKSKRMPLYIENFINEGVDLLLHGNGYQFLQNYYNYIEKIYNLKIPLREIASKGRIKKSIGEYMKDCKTLTTAGQKKSRQAWYELVIRDDVKVDIGETVYYINTGKAKSHSDIKRVTHFFQNIEGEKVEITKEIDKTWAAYRKECKNTGVKSEYKNKNEFIQVKYPNLIEEDELIFNAILLDNEVVEAEDDTFCTDDMEYNVEKYIDQFNKRIKPLLVCFNSNIRESILIKTPDNKQYFTEEETILVANQPYKITDQDTYEQLMTFEDKEIKFWTSINEIPPFVEECGMNWEEIKADYFERMEYLEQEGIKEEKEQYNSIIEKMSKKDIKDFMDDGVLPKQLLSLVDEDVSSNNFISKQYKVVLGTIYDILDKIFVDKNFLDNNEERFNAISNASVTPESDEVFTRGLGNLVTVEEETEETEEE